MGKRIIIFGGGPSGLFCAERVAQARPDYEVIVIEAKRYVGRKFLIAGKSGLNLTNAEAMPEFANHYSEPQDRWLELIAQFDNAALRAWAADLGFKTFESSGKKVFPEPIKSGPLLRAWMTKLTELGVTFQYQTKLIDLTQLNNQRWRAQLAQPKDQTTEIEFDIGILAMGGASWPQSGSDANWITTIKKLGIQTTPFQPANCGWEIDWPEAIKTDCQGQPLKNIALTFQDQTKQGELTITEYGLEGGPLYHLGQILRQHQTPTVTLDLKPSQNIEQLTERLQRTKRNYIREATRRCNLSPTAAALLKHLPNLGPWKSGQQLAQAIKTCPLQLTQPRPIAEAISSAGGIKWSELDQNLMLKKAPNMYSIGEMIDWEAPTGGFLLQGCFTTAYTAAKSIVKQNRTPYGD